MSRTLAWTGVVGISSFRLPGTKIIFIYSLLTCCSLVLGRSFSLATTASRFILRLQCERQILMNVDLNFIMGQALWFATSVRDRCHEHWHAKLPRFPSIHAAYVTNAEASETTASGVHMWMEVAADPVLKRMKMVAVSRSGCRAAASALKRQKPWTYQYVNDSRSGTWSNMVVFCQRSQQDRWLQDWA